MSEIGIDVRLPIGGLFSALGVVIGGYGLMTASDPALYARSLGININLWWGGAMLVFGVLMLLGARAGRRRMDSSSPRKRGSSR